MIRPAARQDWARIREICALTGKQGDPIARERFPFFGEYWVGPYQAWARDAAWVSEVDGQVTGYLTGCWDTRSLMRKRDWISYPLLVLALSTRQFPPSDDTRRFLRRFFRLEKSPDASFSREFWARLLRDYPAHLHTNTDAPYRGRGLGGALLETYSAELLRRRIPGVHLFCGEKPLAFYRKHGFTELARVEFRPGVPVYCLGRLIT